MKNSKWILLFSNGTYRVVDSSQEVEAIVLSEDVPLLKWLYVGEERTFEKVESVKFGDPSSPGDIS